jgi:hypothetical protein
MATERQPSSQPSKPGIVHIVRQSRAGDATRPFDFLISFGGKAGSGGAFYLGRAFSSEDLSSLLAKIGVPKDEVSRAVQAMTGQSSHEIPNVTLSRGFLRNLGL